MNKEVCAYPPNMLINNKKRIWFIFGAMVCWAAILYICLNTWSF
jgi:hypothetical protein